MNNLHRELAPISDKAWAQIEEEASRTLKRHLAARRVVDVPDPKGLDLAAVGTGHTRPIKSPGDGIQVAQHDAKALIELRVPFELSRQQIDDVERGAADSDWSPVKEAARKIAFAEDRAVFDGYEAAGIQGIRQGSSNTAIALPASVRGYAGAVAQAVSQLRLAGCNGPYALVLGTDAYTAASGGSDARRRLRAGYRSGHLDRLSQPFEHDGGALFPGVLHVPSPDDRGLGRANSREEVEVAIYFGEDCFRTSEASGHDQDIQGR
jgi:uncharacterized linocin/CFP29 family protein